MSAATMEAVVSPASIRGRRPSRGVAAAAAMAAVLAGACDSPTVPVRVVAYQYAYEGLGEPVVYRWPVGHTIRVHLVATADPADASALREAFDHAVAAWSDAVLYGQYRFSASSLEEADVVLAWSGDPLPLDVSDCAPLPFGLAWTTFCTDSSGTAIDAYPITTGQHRDDGVHMIVHVLRSESAIPGRVAGLVTHEFGHVLGIGTHPCRFDSPGCVAGEGAHESVMFAGVPERDSPSSADRATVELLYNTNADLLP